MFKCITIVLFFGGGVFSFLASGASGDIQIVFPRKCHCPPQTCLLTEKSRHSVIVLKKEKKRL